MQRRDCLKLGAGAAGWTVLGCPRPQPGETHADRMAWWRDARFGMFIHFGLYSTLGGEWKGKPAGSHEWIRNNAKIPHEEYVPLLNQFNPTGFDADAWVSAAKDAGQKYVVITTKHHEGFSLFDSAVTTYDVMSTPFRRDIMREIADADRGAGQLVTTATSQGVGIRLPESAPGPLQPVAALEFDEAVHAGPGPQR